MYQKAQEPIKRVVNYKPNFADVWNTYLFLLWLDIDDGIAQKILHKSGFSVRTVS